MTTVTATGMPCVAATGSGDYGCSSSGSTVVMCVNGIVQSILAVCGPDQMCVNAYCIPNSPASSADNPTATSTATTIIASTFSSAPSVLINPSTASMQSIQTEPTASASTTLSTANALTATKVIATSTPLSYLASASASGLSRAAVAGIVCATLLAVVVACATVFTVVRIKRSKHSHLSLSLTRAADPNAFFQHAAWNPSTSNCVPLAEDDADCSYPNDDYDHDDEHGTNPSGLLYSSQTKFIVANSLKPQTGHFCNDNENKNLQLTAKYQLPPIRTDSARSGVMSTPTPPHTSSSSYFSAKPNNTSKRRTRLHLAFPSFLQGSTISRKNTATSFSDDAFSANNCTSSRGGVEVGVSHRLSTTSILSVKNVTDRHSFHSDRVEESSQVLAASIPSASSTATASNSCTGSKQTSGRSGTGERLSGVAALIAGTVAEYFEFRENQNNDSSVGAGGGNGGDESENMDVAAIARRKTARNWKSRERVACKAAATLASVRRASSSGAGGGGGSSATANWRHSLASIDSEPLISWSDRSSMGERDNDKNEEHVEALQNVRAVATAKGSENTNNTNGQNNNSRRIRISSSNSNNQVSFSSRSFSINSRGSNNFENNYGNINGNDVLVASPSDSRRRISQLREVTVIDCGGGGFGMLDNEVENENRR
ncbi:hypothetical protein HK100_009362 [Physocladia obscura]|uniref:Uncharacterized protein n=1 Tax=Physocladia obscura TaxID=109957 RepID=A0AAD5T3C7_9FUNG|nr:hypothetical protein HK100_009362 [Physocladia obscura]